MGGAIDVRRGAIILSASLLLQACVSQPGDASMGSGSDGAVSLENTAWQLVEIRGSDSSDNLTEADGSALYTALFNADGSVNFRLDCNRGFGQWQADEDGGTISITVGGVTRAMCPPGSISDQVSAAYAELQRYSFEGGMLVLEPASGTSVYVWESMPSSEE